MALTLQNINETFTNPESVITQSLIKSNKLLAIVPFKPASHGNQDKSRLYETGSTGASILNASTAMAGQELSPSVETIDLTILGERAIADAIFVDTLPVEQYGSEKYITWFEEQSPIFYNQIGKDLEDLMLYGVKDTAGATFNGILKTATDNSAIQDLAGGSGSSTDIFAIRFDDKQSFGVYNKRNADRIQDLVEFKWRPGAGQTVLVSNVDQYMGVYSMEAGLRLLGDNTVAGITGIDSTHKPTLAMVKSMLGKVDYNKDRSSTYIIANAEGIEYLEDILGGTLNRYANQGGTDLTDEVTSFKGVKIIEVDSIRTDG